MSTNTDTTLVCTTTFLHSYSDTLRSRWLVTASRSALAHYVAWEYGHPFAATFMRYAVESTPAKWVVPNVAGETWDTRQAAQSSATRVVAAHAHTLGKLGQPLDGGNIVVMRSRPDFSDFLVHKFQEEWQAITHEAYAREAAEGRKDLHRERPDRLTSQQEGGE